jgi:glutaminase
MQIILENLVDELRQEAERGEVATYIPELATVPNHHLAIAVATADGGLFHAGDSNMPFSIQSVSKIFTLAIALGRVGDQLWTRVGREPSGNAFNSIVLLENEQGRPRNPFINAGAIVTTDEVLAGRTPKLALAEILGFVRAAADDPDIHINKAVARSEMNHGHKNAALAHFLRSFDNLKNPPDLTLGTYFHQCAIEMTVQQLAMAGRFLVDAPQMPAMISREKARRICALMMTCGHYNGSGEFAFQVGLPGKSGVGGGILGIVPGKASIAVWAPGLNAQGNSLIGTKAIALLAKQMGWSVF